MREILELQRMIDEAKNIVFFGGAGVSTESGIKDFRSVDGLYNEKYDFPPEVMLSRSFFDNHQEEFFKFYKDKLNCLDIEPNVTHKYLKKLEDIGKLKAIITQNIDGLHEKSGSKNVLLLHGTVFKNHCIECNKEYSAEYVFNSKGIPKCTCGGTVKPDVVLYEEPLNENVVAKAIEAIKNCDLLIVAGTSLVVYPAASYIRYFNGKYLVIVNIDSTTYDSMADLVIHDKLGNIFGKLK
ncbi:MAG: NAD-dependent protein deacylase [Candidatus Coprovivens sp.]